MKRILIFLFFVIISTFFLSSPALAEGLETLATVTYKVEPAAKKVKVKMEVKVTNQDPSSAYNPSGFSSPYQAFYLPILKEVRQVKARSVSGEPLELIILKSAADSRFNRAQVIFPKPLFYKESFSFLLEYFLQDLRLDDYFFSQKYLFFPALGVGDSPTIKIIAPASPYKTRVDYKNCTKERRGETVQFNCSPPKEESFLAFFEVIGPQSRTSRKFPLKIGKKKILLEIIYFEGEENWVLKLKKLLKKALPKLSESYGLPYQGPKKIEIIQAGRNETTGYSGLFHRTTSKYRINLLPANSEKVVIHEASHIWTHLYKSPWIREGMAELTTDMVLKKLALRPKPRSLNTTFFPKPLFPLDEWKTAASFSKASVAKKRETTFGYIRALAFFKILNQTLGEETLKKINRKLAAAGRPATSERFMDLLEEESGANLDALFQAWVFPPKKAPLLQKRREVRSKWEKLNEEIRRLSLSPPLPVLKNLEEWNFEEAEENITQAQKALPPFKKANKKLSLPPNFNFWEKTGRFFFSPKIFFGIGGFFFEKGDFKRASFFARLALATIERVEALGKGLFSSLILILFIIFFSFRYGLGPGHR